MKMRRVFNINIWDGSPGFAVGLFFPKGEWPAGIVIIYKVIFGFCLSGFTKSHV